jgi:dynactin complex subunit
MSNIHKNASSLTGAIADELNKWLLKNKENGPPKEIFRGVENWSRERLTSAILQVHELLTSLYNELLRVQEEQYKSNYAKNEFLRTVAKSKAIDLTKALIEDNNLKSFADIFIAKENCENIHAYPHKQHKLEIVSGFYPEFGQFIIDQKSEKND